MKQYRVSDAARADLDEIWLVIAEDDLDAADRFIRKPLRFNLFLLRLERRHNRPMI